MILEIFSSLKEESGIGMMSREMMESPTIEVSKRQLCMALRDRGAGLMVGLDDLEGLF